MNDTNTIPARALQRHLETLIDDAEKQAYGFDADYRTGEIHAYREAVRNLGAGPAIDTFKALRGCENGWAGACGVSDFGRGCRGAWAYLASLFRDYAAGDVTARAILADLGPDPVTGA